MNSMAFNVVWFLSVFVFSEANILFLPSWPNFRCTLYHAVDLGRYLNSDSYYLTEPFVTGNVTTNTLGNYTFRLNSFCSGEHVGTHVNAPYQFNEHGWTVDEIPLHHLIANGVFMNLTKEAAGNSSFLLQPRHIIDWIRRNGLIPMNSILLVSFGWSQLNRTQYMGTDSTDPSQVRQPAISLEAARMLIDMKKFVGIAFDTMSLDVTGEAVIRSITSAENIYSIQQLLFPTHCLPVNIGQTCELNTPLDLGRPLSRDSVHASAPFTAPEINKTMKFGTTYRTNSFCGGEHLGTHLDAPSHFSENGWTVDQIPLQRLIANGVFLNVSEEAAGNSSFRLQPSHIDVWIALHGFFPPNAVLLISYGWAQLYANRTAYLGTTSSNFDDFIYPGMTVECAQRLAEIEEIVGIGVDTASVDAPNDGRAHAILAAKNIYNLEHVDLDQPCLPAKGFKLLSFPMKIAHGTGAPARIIAIP